ncbi:universal stress protein [Fulvimonas yonginensis]|uniref:Universal stress protein n=1 Tax=Fulvimonas yonginensis TaxID=1495200 RepID=A0ABU8JDZ2_9GAMM
MRDVVVLSPGFRSWHASVRYAARLAATTQAVLTGLYVGARHAPMPGPPLLAEEMSAYMQDELQQAMLAGHGFAEWARQLGVRDARWQVAIGRTADALALAGNWNDVVVLPCAVSPHPEDERLIRETLHSGAACIAVPDAGLAPAPVICAAVAWNGTVASSRALHAALPLLRLAQAVVLLQPGKPDAGPRADALAHLHAHGVSVSAVESLDGPDEDVVGQILMYASEHHADLLVMGASGRRWRDERCFGATTTGVLAGSRLPMFLRS